MPFAIGAALAIIGGPIGLFCASFAHNLAHYEPMYAFTMALGMSLLPISLIPAIMVALPFTTLLLPAAYYLTRAKLDVTPLRYAITGAVLAIGLALLSMPGGILRAPRVDLPPLIEQQGRLLLVGMSLGTVLAGLVCGLLFGVMVRAHYERYRAARSATAAG